MIRGARRRRWWRIQKLSKRGVVSIKKNKIKVTKHLHSIHSITTYTNTAQGYLLYYPPPLYPPLDDALIYRPQTCALTRFCEVAIHLRPTAIDIAKNTIRGGQRHRAFGGTRQILITQLTVLVVNGLSSITNHNEWHYIVCV